MLETEYKFGEVHDLASQIELGHDRPHFKNIFGSKHGGVALVALEAGQKLDTHTAPAEVMVCVLEGDIDFTMLDRTMEIKAGQFLLMGEGVPHSVLAKADTKIVLIKVEP